MACLSKVGREKKTGWDLARWIVDSLKLYDGLVVEECKATGVPDLGRVRIGYTSCSVYLRGWDIDDAADG